MTKNLSVPRPKRLRWLGPPLLSVGALVAAAVPAAAAETIQGAGAGVGYGTIDVVGNPVPTRPTLCLPGSSGSEYVIDVAGGSVAAAEGTSAAEYAGPLTVTIDFTASFFFNPAGTFSNATCTTPAAVAANIIVTGSNLTGSVNCPADSGKFQRVNTTITFNEVGVDNDGTCTVASVTNAGGLTSVTVSPVTHALAGNEYPCISPPSPPSPSGTTTCPSPVDQVHVQGEWTVTGADTIN